MLSIRRSFLAPLAVVLLSVSCSEAPDAVSDDAVDEHDRLRSEVLSPEEKATLVERLSDQGVRAPDLEFFGRLVALQGDMLFSADDLLRQLGVGGPVDKGKVVTATSVSSSGFPNCSVAVCGAVRPFQYAFGLNPPQNMAFRRPDVTKIYYLVVDDNAPSFFTTTPSNLVSQFGSGGLIGIAAARIENVTGDCMGSTLFNVMRNAAYQALPLATRQANYRTRVTHGQFFTTCSDDAVGCANFPRLASVHVNGAPTERLRFGDRVAFVTVPLGDPNDTIALNRLSAYSLGIATHELLHTMGIGHPQLSPGEERTVPGTASGTTHLSIMHGDTIQNDNYRDTLQSDDIATIRKLYGGDCVYRSTFRTITP